NFKDPLTGAHTNNIERLWRDAKASVPKYGRSSKHFSGYLGKFMFSHRFPKNSQKFHYFLLELAKDYPVVPHLPTVPNWQLPPLLRDPSAQVPPIQLRRVDAHRDIWVPEPHFQIIPHPPRLQPITLRRLGAEEDLWAVVE
ncbi:unnamed protein product, partial [Meganyctiphanes norvegica]